MGLLQLYLRPGKQRVNLTNNIPKGNIIVRHLYSSFNVENHGFYMLTFDAPFLYANNTMNNTNVKKGLLLPIKHDASSTFQELNFRLGQVEIPRNFEVNVDLDNGHQIALETNTRAGTSLEFNINPTTPFFTGEDYVRNPPGGAYVSVGLNADKILNNTGTAPQGAIVIQHTSGIIDGPQPFLYCLLLTIEYDDGLVEERLQQLLS